MIRSVRRTGAALAAAALVLAGPAPARADSVRDKQWYLDTLNVAAAQRISKGADVVVAVLDTGVDAKHPDLKGAVLAGNNTTRPGAKGNADTEGHGTGMAGIIAARGRGTRGLVGIAPAAKILPIRPATDPEFAADGIRWAVRNGAQVINMSFGLPDSETLHSAIREAAEADVVLVSSVGNTGDKGNAPDYPGAYPEVIGVGAIGRDGKVAKFSQHGAQVDLVAPGVDIEQAGVAGSYRNGFGSSNSAAVVSGAAALIRAKYPDLKAQQVVDRLTGTADDKGDKGRDDFYGHGEIDLVKALTAPQPASSSPASPPAGAPAAAPPVQSSDTDEGGIPPLVFIAAGVLLLIIAGGAVTMAVRRSRT
ncbi:S8 family serine peptidase [Actinoplanes sp. NPDC089786]|uniref:S8 family serine peptidase n=1 Tax=Actinoplanes sp. NPDC089786 TaxID=3155185 RepID=UPI00341D5A28